MKALADVLLSLAVPCLLLGSGCFFYVYLHGVPLRHPVRGLRMLCRPPQGSGITPFRAMTLSLAGTLGVGNIVGVATALVSGGAGAVLWMLVGAVCALPLKYAEIVLGVRHQRRKGKKGVHGGAMCYLEDVYGACGVGKPLSWLFALLLLVCAMTMGSMIQSRAVSQVLLDTFRMSPLLVACLLVLFCLPFVVGGASGIASLTEYLVPIMSLGFLVLSCAVLWLRRDVLGDALVQIVREAFTLPAVGGGALGLCIPVSVRYGITRGLISNEAGCGTSPTAHASGEQVDPVVQGLWGTVEVVVDTVVLCTVTALCILTSGVPLAGDGMTLTLQAYTAVLGEWASYFLAIAVLCFGVATILCWSAYGRAAYGWLCRGRKRWFCLLYVLSVGVGCFLSPAWVWSAVDLCVGLMTVINVPTLIMARREIRAAAKGPSQMQI